MTYTFTATTPGTRAYYSGTQGDLQVEMGMYGAIIVVPSSIPTDCTSGMHTSNTSAQSFHGENRLPAGGSRVQPSRGVLRPGVPVPVFRNGSADSPRGGSSSRLPQCTGCMTVATEPYVPGLLHDQRALDAGRHGSELCVRNIRTSPTTAIRTCIRASWCCCASSARDAGSIPSTSTATTCACWRAMGT